VEAGLDKVGRWPVYVLNDWQECLVRITAHEVMHIVQRLRGRSQSEIACERYAEAMLGEFRDLRP
jgi:hypothetical protein